MLRRHVGQRAAQAVARGRGVQRLKGQIEIDQQRPAVLVEHDVARLDVAVQNAVAVGEVEGLGQAGTDPADGLRPVEPGEQFAVPQRGRIEGRRPVRRADRPFPAASARCGRRAASRPIRPTPPAASRRRHTACTTAAYRGHKRFRRRPARCSRVPAGPSCGLRPLATR